MARTVETEIMIDAPAPVVWRILCDFKRLSEWNPLMPHIEGEQEVGGLLKVVVKVGKRPTIAFKTRLLRYQPNRELCWRGGFVIPGLASGEHRFVIEPLASGGVRFVHSETFRGLAIALLFPLMHRELRASFEAMNLALKARAAAVTEDGATGLS